LVENKVLNCLKKLSKRYKSNARICLHSSTKSKLHQMIVCQLKKNDHPAKLHRNREKSYQVLDGSLKVTIFSKKGSILSEYFLSKKNIIPLRVPAGVFHHDRPTSARCIHLETIEGQFISSSDRKLL